MWTNNYKALGQMLAKPIAQKSLKQTTKMGAKQFHSSTILQRTPVPDPGEDSQSAEYVKTIISPYTATTYNRPNLVFTHGKGSLLYDLENTEYIDFVAGIAVTALGHSNTDISNIIQNQASTLMHCSNLYHNLHAGELCNKLVTRTISTGGMHDAERVFLCNSGSEANEAALKFARKWAKSISKDKYEIINFENSFHGRTMGAVSATANKKYTEPFAPLVPGIKTAIPNDIESVKALISKEKTCAVIIEPIQGEGGVTEINQEFLINLKQLCVENEVVLIYDEIQCGLGRSGKFWAHSNLPPEAHPDIVTMAKALGNGFPVGATMINDKVEKQLAFGDHGTTYGGNPLAAKVGSYMVDRLSDKEFLQEVESKSEMFTTGLTEIAGKYPDSITVKGKGLLLGLQFNESIDIGAIIQTCRQNGLLVLSAGMNVIRFVPALNIPNDLIEEGLSILAKSIDEHLK